MPLLDKDTGIWLLLQVNTKGKEERKNYEMHRTSKMYVYLSLVCGACTLGNLSIQEAEAREL